MLERRARFRDQALELGRGWSGADTPASWRLTAALFDVLAEDATLLELAGEKRLGVRFLVPAAGGA